MSEPTFSRRFATKLKSSAHKKKFLVLPCANAEDFFEYTPLGAVVFNYGIKQAKTEIKLKSLILAQIER